MIQLFAIGFTLGMSGPCLFACVPVVSAYVSGTKKSPREIFPDIFVFLSGRLLSTVFWGVLAGFSAKILRGFLSSPSAEETFRRLGGGLIILLAILVLLGKVSVCGVKLKKIGSGGVFLFGILIGLAPCPPFIALFAEIMLISKSIAGSILYSFSFGLGLFVSGLIALSLVSGILTAASSKFFVTSASRRIFRFVCALLIALIGVKWIL
ncbi:MAG: sulfite exporter TauE/SafE family protein [Elusimicrobia bacterium]|nr:sulfite exporter TauE/SafE family protein [Elusimicrobiota bacterium]